MNPPKFCSSCGSPLTSPEAPCPRCLLELGERPSQPSPAAPTWATPAPTVDEIAPDFPALQVLELVGRGGMGFVYKGRQRDLDRFVALKVLPPECSADPAFAERFEREARVLAHLDHPNVVKVFDAGQSGGRWWLTMEFVEGVNLRHLIDQGQVDPARALAIVMQICSALQYAHDQGIVHRDIKPENILIDTTGRVKIADFGLAKLLSRDATGVTLTRSDQALGTLHYMAPEQVRRPLEVDHRADIYSLGVVFYELLTGELPLGNFPLPSDRKGVDARLDEVVLRSLEREPERRYQSAEQVSTDVDGVSKEPGEPALAAAASLHEQRGRSLEGRARKGQESFRRRRSKREGPGLGALVLGVGCLGSLGLVGLLFLGGITLRGSQARRAEYEHRAASAHELARRELEERGGHRLAAFVDERGEEVEGLRARYEAVELQHRTIVTNEEGGLYRVELRPFPLEREALLVDLRTWLDEAVAGAELTEDEARSLEELWLPFGESYHVIEFEQYPGGSWRVLDSIRETEANGSRRSSRTFSGAQLEPRYQRLMSSMDLLPPAVEAAPPPSVIEVAPRD